MERVMSEVASIHNAYPPGNLASYAAQSPEERRVILNEFFLQHIDSDDFVKLVEDVETSWAIIGMGLE
jgi:hypothetical protein